MVHVNQSIVEELASSPIYVSVIAMSDDSILELVSQVDEFLEISELFNDKDMDMALSKVVRIISDPGISPVAATTAIIHLQGLATKFYIQASYMKNVSKPKAGTEEYHKKNMLFAMATALENLIAALKYGARIG